MFVYVSSNFIVKFTEQFFVCFMYYFCVCSSCITQIKGRTTWAKALRVFPTLFDGSMRLSSQLRVQSEKVNWLLSVRTLDNGEENVVQEQVPARVNAEQRRKCGKSEFYTPVQAHGCQAVKSPACVGCMVMLNIMIPYPAV